MRQKRKKKRDDDWKTDFMLVIALTSMMVSIIGLIRNW